MSTKKYLYIEKRQRINIENKLPKKAQRLIDELKTKGYESGFAYSDDISIEFHEGELIIKAAGHDIKECTHVIFGGHFTNRDYEIKRIIIDYAEKHNHENPTSKILVQNAQFIKTMPYYSKIMMAKICVDNDLPHLNTYYQSIGDYKDGKLPFTYPVIVKHYYGENDLVMIDGQERVKKTVFKVENEEDWNQERLGEKDFKEYFVQEFADAGEDIRTFVSNGKIIAGWKRVATEGFMTVTKGSEYVYFNDPDEEIQDIARRAAKAWGVDFMALDFIYKNGKPYILEFSMHPGFNAYETKCSGGEPVNIADAIIESFSE